ncbi:MAG: FolC bifunctional protein [Solirubrobacterales bacterium]|nr:FolC bifunctional protein [Solirubrobacterales bacterium]
MAPRPAESHHWSLADAERYLLGLELFGMRFGLDRMRRLLTALDQPQERYPTIHVVGSNGKSSTTRMTAAILQRHGLRSGAYLSPHLTSFAERVRVDDRDADPGRFAAAVQRAAHAAELVDRTGGEDDRVTQFEALTAAAFAELAAEEVDVAVIEAGLGGRYDATNVLPSTVQVLTNVELEHTRWLGPTRADIAAEKADVVRPGATLVLGAGLHPDARAVAERVAAEREATIVDAPADPDGVDVAALGGYQRRNFATAMTAARAYLGELDDAAVADAAAHVAVPGRFQVVDDQLVLDGAHNAAGMAALAESLPAFLAGRSLVAVLSILDDKDASAMLAELLPLCDQVVFCRIDNPRALSPGTLASLSRQLGGPAAHTERDVHAAVELARELAGSEGVVLVTGSIYLLADLLRPRGSQGSTL